MFQPQFDAFLEDISECFTKRDFSQWQARIVYPFTLVTASGPLAISGDSDLRATFEMYLISYDAMRLDEMVHTPRSLQDCKDGTWIGTYETNLLSKGTRVVAPFTSSALMVREAGAFKMMSILNAYGPHDQIGNQRGPQH